MIKFGILYIGMGDTPWLKNALMYWEKIYVIVPSGVSLTENSWPSVDRETL